MGTTGAQLKQVRLQKGISLEDASKKTRIHLNVLKALEEDSLVNLSPVYLKGFLKIYCKFLGVDSRDLAPEARGAVVGAPEPAERKTKQPVTLAPLKDASMRMKKALVVTVAGLFAVAFLFHIGRNISLRRHARLDDRKAKASALLPAIKTRTAQEDTARKSSKTEKPVSSVIKLALRTRGDCWVLLKADGKTVFQGVLKKGRAESWQAKEKIEFSLGNAGVVDLEVNGKLISQLGRKGQVVKNAVVTHEGLSLKP